MAGILKKIWTGGRDRKSRFHDWRGNHIGLGGMAYLPRCAWSVLANKTFGYRSPIPWLGYRAIAHIEGLLQPDWKMIEFGSGMSTVWFARRCAHVLSIEDNRDWFDKVQGFLTKHAITNVELRYRPPGPYPILDDVPNASIDFVLVDGAERRECCRNVIPKVKPGGYVYLDNCDMASNDLGDNFREGEALLLDAVRERGGTSQYFVDFSPGCLFASQGVLVRL
jgi:hypothetical protein